MFPMSLAGFVRIYHLNCSKEDALKDLSHGKVTHIVEHIIRELPSVKGINNRSNICQSGTELILPWMSWTLQIPSSATFPFLTTCQIRLDQIITALHNRYQSGKGSIQNTATARFLLVARYLQRKASTALPHTEQVTKNEGCVLPCSSLSTSLLTPSFLELAIRMEAQSKQLFRRARPLVAQDLLSCSGLKCNDHLQDLWTPRYAETLCHAGAQKMVLQHPALTIHIQLLHESYCSKVSPQRHKQGCLNSDLPGIHIPQNMNQNVLPPSIDTDLLWV